MPLVSERVRRLAAVEAVEVGAAGVATRAAEAIPGRAETEAKAETEVRVETQDKTAAGGV